MTEQQPYNARLDAFLARHGATDVPSIYHAVRNLGYYSSGDRTPDAVMETGRGACTAKHILLRDLLRRHGETAAVEIVGGDFAEGIPVVKGMPQALVDMIRQAGVLDYHCYVVWRGPERELKLDATWPDAVAPYGFTVNADWAGEGDTTLALRPTLVKVREENVVEEKEKLLSGLNTDQLETRRAFLKLLSDWLAENT